MGERRDRAEAKRASMWGDEVAHEKNSEKRCFSRSKQYKKAASVQMEGVEAKFGQGLSERAKASEAEDAGHPQAEKLLPNFLSDNRKQSESERLFSKQRTV